MSFFIWFSNSGVGDWRTSTRALNDMYAQRKAYTLNNLNEIIERFRDFFCYFSYEKLKKAQAKENQILTRTAAKTRHLYKNT